MAVFSAEADLPICEFVFGGPTDRTPVFQAFVFSPRPGRILAEIYLNSKSTDYTGSFVPMPTAGFATCDFPGLVVDQAPERLLLSDGEWTGLPWDSLFPNVQAIPRINSSADIERIIPLYPDEQRRNVENLGAIEILNTDRSMNSLLADKTVGDQQVKLRLVPADDDSANGQIIGQMLGDQFAGNQDTIRLLVKSSSTYLDQPAWTRKYSGTGGLQGDAGIAGQIVPSSFGDCPNITPVLTERNYWMYQFHDGPAQAVDAFKEKGNPFTFISDFPTDDTLRAHVFADIGQYATCLALGLARGSFPVDGPAGPITLDVRGHKDNAGYTNRTGEILSKLAIERAGLTPALIDVQSFARLPTGPTGFYAGQNALQVSDIFNSMIGGLFGWYGADRHILLRAGILDQPETKAASFVIDEDQIIAIEQVELQNPPRWKQTVTYAPNFTPMAEADVSVLLDAETRADLIASNKQLTASAFATKLRERSAQVAPDLATFFREQDDAQAVLNRVMSLFQESRRMARVTMWRTGYLINSGTYVMLQTRDLGFDAGKMMIVLGIKDSGNSDQVTLTLYG